MTKISDIVSRAEEQRCDIESQIRSSLQEHGIPAASVLIECAAEMAEDEAWRGARQHERFLLQSEQTLLALTSIATAWRKLTDVLEAAPIGAQLILREHFAQLGPIGAAIEKEREAAQEFLPQLKRERRRPPEPESGLILDLAKILLSLQVPRKRAARWLSWYFGHFAGVQRNPPAIDQLIRNTRLAER